MKLKHPALFGFLAGLQVFSSLAAAMPETTFNSRLNQAIPKMIVATGGDLAAVKAKFSITQVPELDQLWDSRRDVVQGSCVAPHNDCRTLSVFQGHASNHPVVMLPGFTAYRKMYLEEIYDLIQEGFGPIYISDFAGTGDSYKPELAPGQPEPSVAQSLQVNPVAAPLFTKKVNAIVGGSNVDLISKTIQQLPVGIGHIDKFSAYQDDIDFIMNQAVRENPSAKIMVTSLSMSGLALVIAIDHQNHHPTWISHVDRMVLESPMIRTLGTNLLMPGLGLGSITQVIAQVMTLFASTRVFSPAKALPEFADKALGSFNPNNVISHSPYRLSMTDSIRVYDGHETTGATFGWSYQELANQFSVGPLDSKLFFVHPLNFRVFSIAKALNKYNIKIVTVASHADGIVDTKATEMFLQNLADADAQGVSLCTFETSKHVMDQESEKYREPFMQLVIDQKDGVVRRTYGSAPANEVLKCQTLSPSHDKL